MYRIARHLAGLLGMLCIVPTAASADLATFLRADMGTPHERSLHGVPLEWDWATNPVLKWQQYPGTPRPDYTAFNGWGQIYRCANAPYDPDDYVEIKDLTHWLQLSDGTWQKRIADSPLKGAAYREDFSGNTTATPSYYARSDFWMKVRQVEGHNFHFYPSHRTAWDPSIRNIVVTARARLIGVGKANCVGLSIGGDHWRDKWAPYPNVAGAGVGRHKLVDGAWRVFSFTLYPDLITDTDVPPAVFADSELR